MAVLPAFTPAGVVHALNAAGLLASAQEEGPPLLLAEGK